MKDKTRINRDIRVPNIRLIDQNGKQIGVVPTHLARGQAEEAGLDLVEVSPNADPPVCKIMDYGKYLFERKKKAKEQRKNSKTNQTKTVKLRPKIGKHDLDTKMNQAAKFIQGGNKVKVQVTFKGREITHKDIARRLLNDFSSGVGGDVNVEALPKMEGRSMIMILAPK